MTKEELRVVREEELLGDLPDIIDFLVEIREQAMEKGFTSIELERYYGNADGYLVLTGIRAKESDRFDESYWDSDDDLGELDDPWV